MRFKLTVDGRLHEVEVGINKVIAVQVDGETFLAEAERTDKGMAVKIGDKDYSLRFEGSRITMNGDKHEVRVSNLRRGVPSWHYGGEAGEDGRPIQKGPSAEGQIHPPMPGRVVSLKVNVGDKVRIGTPVLVLEAMKMQNEIISTVDGEVKEIRVAEGDLVETGDVMVVIGS